MTYLKNIVPKYALISVETSKVLDTVRLKATLLSQKGVITGIKHGIYKIEPILEKE